MSEYLQKIIYLTRAQYDTLSGGGTVGSQTGLNSNYLYCTTDENITTADLGDLIVPVSKGGTGKTSFTVGSILVGNGSNALTEMPATNANTANTIVKRDSNGDFNAGIVTTTKLSSPIIKNVTKLYPDNESNLLLAYKQSGTGVTASQWMVGTIDIQGVIRSSNTDLLHSRNGTNSVILDAGNYKTYAWAVPSSITSGQVILSSGTDGSTTLREILNNTSAGALGWNNGGATNANNLRLINVNTLAYWNGAYSGTTSNITKLGTISNGTWQGTAIGIAYGGTGISTTNPHKVLIGPSSGTAVAAPTWRVIDNADLPGSGKITIAGTDVALGESISLATMGLSNALHFIGITSTTLTDGSTTATLTPKSTNSLSKTTGFTDGDVVMDGDQLREYVWSNNAWRLLGITTSTAYTQPASTATNTWIAQISQGTDGKITATTGSLNTSGQWSGNAATATNISSKTPTLAAAIESNEIKIIDLGNNNPASGAAQRHAIDFRWYDSHWAIGNIRSSSTPSAGFGFSYSSDGGTTYSNLVTISTSGNITATGDITASALYVGTDNSYGDAYTPIYWNDGVPSKATTILKETFTLGTSSMASAATVTTTISNNTSADSRVVQIVVTGGMSNLHSTIEWQINSSNQIQLSATTLKVVSGYILYIK